MRDEVRSRFSTVNQRQVWDAVLYFRFCVSAIYKICLKSCEMLFKVCTNRALNICVSVSKFGLYKKIEFKVERCNLELRTWLAVAGLFILGKKKSRLVRYGWHLLIYGCREVLSELSTLLLGERTDHEQVWLENRKTFSCKSSEFRDSLTAWLVEMEALTEVALHLFRKEIFTAWELKLWI